MTTWIDVMALVRALRDKRAAGQPLDGQDAGRLLEVLHEFHDHAVASTPPPDLDDVRSRSERAKSP